MAFERALFILAYDATAFAGDDFLTSPLGDYSMRLFDPAMPALPLSHVGYKTAYHLILPNFPSKARVQVTALQATHETSKRANNLPCSCDHGRERRRLGRNQVLVDRGVSPRR